MNRKAGADVVEEPWLELGTPSGMNEAARDERRAVGGRWRVFKGFSETTENLLNDLERQFVHRLWGTRRRVSVSPPASPRWIEPDVVKYVLPPNQSPLFPTCTLEYSSLRNATRTSDAGASLSAWRLHVPAARGSSLSRPLPHHPQPVPKPRTLTLCPGVAAGIWLGSQVSGLHAARAGGATDLGRSGSCYGVCPVLSG